jgi:hypothetical protein
MNRWLVSMTVYPCLMRRISHEPDETTIHEDDGTDEEGTTMSRKNGRQKYYVAEIHSRHYDE